MLRVFFQKTSPNLQQRVPDILSANFQSFSDNGGRVKFLGRFATFFVVAIIAWQAAGLTWKLLGPVPEEAFTPLARPAGDAGRFSALSGRGGKPGASVSELPLFGISTVPAAEQLSARSEAPITSLALILKGVVMADPASRALAVIAEKGKPELEKLYGQGEKVPGDAVVQEILFDRVILRRGGVLETLLLLGQEKEVLTARPSLSARPAGDGVNWQIDRDYWNGKLADIPSLAKEVGVEIYRENNIQKGYRLLSSRGSKLLKDMGLEPGDILHEVNGVPLNSVHDGLAVYQNIADATEVRITISRNGNRESRVYRIGN